MNKNKSYKLAQENIQIYWNAMEFGHSAYEASAKLNDLYYRGVQWSPEEEAALGDRPNLTINLVFKLVNTIKGLYEGSSCSIKASPRELELDAKQAAAINAVLTYALETADYKNEEATAFEDGIIMNRGYLDVDVNFDDNFLGNVEIKAIDPMDIIPDPNAKSYNPEDWGYYLELKWASIQSIEEAYGKVIAKKIKNEISSWDQQDWGYNRGETRNKFATDEHRYFSSWFNAGNEDNPRYMVRIINRNEKLLQSRWLLVDSTSGDTELLPLSTSKEDAQMQADEYGWELVKRQVPTIHQVITAGESVTLYEGYHSRPFYTITPFFPFFRRGQTPGLIDNIISPQDLLNKTLSQMLHIINSTANSGWIIEDGSLINMDPEDLEEIGSQTGLNIVYKRGSTRPERLQPNDVPRGIDHLSQLSLSLIDQITGIKDIDATQLNSEPAVKDAMKRTALPYAAIFGNLSRTRKLIGEKVLWFIQNYYTEERKVKIDSTDDFGQKSEEYQTINTEDSNTIGDGNYDIVIEDTQAYEEDDLVQFDTLIKMKELEIPVPSHMFVKYSPITDKEDLIQAIQKAENPTEEEIIMQQRMQNAEMGMKEAEVAKMQSDIAHRNAEAARMSTQTAEILQTNPIMAVTAESILQGAWTMNKQQDALQQQEQEALVQQQREGNFNV